MCLHDMAWRLLVQEFEETQITVSVFDADTFSANDLIGSYQFDLAFVHSQDGVCFSRMLSWHSIRFVRAQGVATPETGLIERVGVHVCLARGPNFATWLTADHCVPPSRHRNEY